MEEETWPTNSELGFREKERERDQLSSNFKVDGKIEREVLIKGGNDRLIVSRRNESQTV